MPQVLREAEPECSPELLGGAEAVWLSEAQLLLLELKLTVPEALRLLLPEPALL